MADTETAVKAAAAGTSGDVVKRLEAAEARLEQLEQKGVEWLEKRIVAAERALGSLGINVAEHAPDAPRKPGGVAGDAGADTGPAEDPPAA